MLYAKNRLEQKSKKLIASLFIISIITFQTDVSADIKSNTAQEYRDLGYEQQQKGNFQDALSHYIKAISLGYNDVMILNDMGVLYEQMGRPEEAESFYLRAIKLDPSYLPPYLNLGYFYKEHGDHQKAFLYFKKRFEMVGGADQWAQEAKEEMLKIYPEYQQHFIDQEAKKLNEEMTQRAHNEFYAKVAQAEGHFKQGQLFHKHGYFQKAILEYDIALALTPKNPKILKAKQKADVELSKRNMQEFTDKAIKQLEMGDSDSAKREIQQMLSTIPNY